MRFPDCCDFNFLELEEKMLLVTTTLFRGIEYYWYYGGDALFEILQLKCFDWSNCFTRAGHNLVTQILFYFNCIYYYYFQLLSADFKSETRKRVEHETKTNAEFSLRNLVYNPLLERWMLFSGWRRYFRLLLLMVVWRKTLWELHVTWKNKVRRQLKKSEKKTFKTWHAVNFLIKSKIK